MKNVASLFWREMRSFLDYFLQVGPAVHNAISKCWWIFFIYLAGLALLTFVAQGRDAVIASLDDPNFPFFWLFAATVLAAAEAQVIAGILLARRAKDVGESTITDTPVAFAAHFVSFLFPVLLQLIWPEILKQTVLAGNELKFFPLILLEMPLGLMAAALYGLQKRNSDTGVALIMGLSLPCILSMINVPGLIVIPVALIGIAAVIRSVLAKEAMPQIRWGAMFLVVNFFYGLAAVWTLATVALNQNHRRRLGGHVKTGQWRSPQNRPMERRLRTSIVIT